jgi:putative ABC transport system permease protein
MRDVIYLAWRYLAYHKFITSVLVTSVALIVYLPIGLNILVTRSAEQLRARAQATPLLVGAKGSPLELVLDSLYFESGIPPSMHYAEAQRVKQSGLAAAIPLYTRFRTQHSRIVGTNLEYLEFRSLQVAEGRQMATLGECVLGAKAARRAQVGPGDSIVSAPESVFDISGVYPLKMRVTGILEPAGTPDDHAVFVDLKTAWVIEGLAHGHQDLTRPDAAASVLRRDGNTVVANAAVMQYNEITPDNIDTFHFHGDPQTFPISSVIAIPRDQKSSTLLQGRYLADDENVQIVRPAIVMEQLLATVLTVQRYIMVSVIVVGISTLATMILVFVLSLQLRRREIETMVKIGGSRLRIWAILGLEIAGVLTAGVCLALVLSILTGWFAAAATRLVVLLSS